MKTHRIIIAGTNKAATTSVYQYLGDHPNVCASYVKQTNYFLDSNIQDKWNLDSIYKYDVTTKDYQNFFKANNSEFFLEASPDYMYDEIAIDRLKLFLDSNDGRIILILRNPVSRFKSWFNFGKQTGLIQPDISFQEFYKKSKSYQGFDNQSLMSYKTGFYSNYVKTILNKIEAKKVNVYFYEDLTNDASSFISKIAKDIGLDDAYYKNYEFQHFNKTVKVKSRLITNIYSFFRSAYLKHLYKGSIGVKIGALLKAILSPIYRKLNTVKATNSVDDDTIENLKKDYFCEKDKLQKLLSIKNIPWEF